MRRVLRNTDEVMHFWANAVQEEGRAGNVFFEGEYVYSYGRHFCIGRRLSNGTVVFTTRDYSISTGTHKRAAWSAARYMHVVYCQDPERDARSNLKHARNEVAGLLVKAQAPRIWETTRTALQAQALRVAEGANAYLAALPEDERNAEPIDTSDLAGVAAELVRIEEAERRIRRGQRQVFPRAPRRKEQAAARRSSLLESLQQWREQQAIFIGRTGLYELPPALRLSEDRSTVQTSHGADIPVADAIALWPVIQRVMRGTKDYEPGMPIGHYALTQIRTNGSIRVGCHDIAYSEIEGIAKALGLVETTPAWGR